VAFNLYHAEINLKGEREMGKIKNMLIDVETTLKDCLDNHGMTNQQALKHIENKFGSMGREHADATLKEWNEGIIEGVEDLFGDPDTAERGDTMIISDKPLSH
jgi:hypothetical protein|tara:strand:- start:298 stop:606 length:309 start_codon:yes stop_codon:yes gene_type:complete